MVNRTQPKDVSYIALPVWDNAFDSERLNPRHTDFVTQMRALTYAAVCDANGHAPMPPPSSKVLQNKLTFEKADASRLPEDHPAALGKGRPAIAFNLNGSGTKYLGLPTPDEGLIEVTGSDNPDFERVLQKVCKHPELGGNIPNSGLNQVRMLRSVLAEIDPALRLHIITPSKRITEMILEERQGIEDVLHAVELEGLEERKGLHIDIHFLHEPQGHSYNGVTAMFNSRGPSADTVRSALEPHEALLQQSTVFSPDPRYVRHENVRMIPTTAAMKEVDPADGHGLFMNESELRAFCMHRGIIGKNTPDDWLPGAIRNGMLDHDAIQTASASLGCLSRSMKNTQGARRLLQTGLVDGAQYEMFSANHGTDIMYTSPFEEETEDRIIEIIGSNKVGRHLENKTGRGDAASAASLIDLVDSGLILKWWNHHHADEKTNLSPEQERVFHRTLASIMSRFHSKAVFYCQDPNFFHAMDNASYRRLFEQGVQIALGLARQYTSANKLAPQVLHDTSWDISCVAWSVGDSAVN